MMPGVQKPHWLAPVAQNASAHRSRPIAETLERRDRPAGDTAGGSHARDPWLAVDQHGAAAALPLRAAAVLR